MDGLEKQWTGNTELVRIKSEKTDQKNCIDSLEFCLGSLLSTAYIPAILLDNGVQVTVNDPASNKITTKSSEKAFIIMGRGYTAATAVFLAIGGKVF